MTKRTRRDEIFDWSASNPVPDDGYWHLVEDRSSFDEWAKGRSIGAYSDAPAIINSAFDCGEEYVWMHHVQIIDWDNFWRRVKFCYLPSLVFPDDGAALFNKAIGRG